MDRHINNKKYQGTAIEPGFFQVNGSPKTSVIKFFDHLDSLVFNQYKIPQKTMILLAQGTEKVIIDLSDVSFVNSATIGMIASIAKKGRKVSVICQKKGFVYQIFKKCNLFNFVPRFDNVYEAIAAG